MTVQANAPLHATLPLPNDEFEGKVVVASVWGNDNPEDGPVFATVVLLNPALPFYSVGQIEWDGARWVAVADHRYHSNIVPAIEDYEQSGGDW